MRRSRSFAKHAHLGPRAQPGETKVSRFAARQAKQAAPLIEQLEQIEADDSCRFLEHQLEKMAQLDSTLELGLQLQGELVNSLTQMQPTPHMSPDGAKLAAAADAMDQLSSLVGELRSAHQQSVKVAAALAGAVKLAQDGAVDVEDIFEVARNALLDGSVKLSAVDAVFDQEPGEIVGEAGPHVKHATGPAIPGFSVSGGEERMDVLTAALRSLRGSR